MVNHGKISTDLLINKNARFYFLFSFFRAKNFRNGPEVVNCNHHVTERRSRIVSKVSIHGTFRSHKAERGFTNYSSVDCDTVRPNLDGTDSDGVMNQPQWIIGLNQCNMESTIHHENVTEYHMYWNPNPLPGDVIFGLMNQVRFHRWFSS